MASSSYSFLKWFSNIVLSRGLRCGNTWCASSMTEFQCCTFLAVATYRALSVSHLVACSNLDPSNFKNHFCFKQPLIRQAGMNSLMAYCHGGSSCALFFPQVRSRASLVCTVAHFWLFAELIRFSKWVQNSSRSENHLVP